MRGLPLEIFIAVRYLRGQGRTSLFYPGVRLAILFLSVMIFVMTVVLSVFEGFQNEVRKSLWKSGYHITVSRAPTRLPIRNYKFLANQIREREKKLGKNRIASVFGGVSVNGLLERNGRFEGKLIRAVPMTVDEALSGHSKNYPKIVHYHRTHLKNFPGGNYVLIGRELARYYGWKLGDRITIYLPLGGILQRRSDGTPGIIRRRFTIAGFFRTGYYEYDMNLLYLSLRTAQRHMGLGNAATEIVVQLNDFDTIHAMKKEIYGISEKSKSPGKLKITTISEERKNYLRALQLERFFMIVIMTLLMMAGAAGIGVVIHQLVKAKRLSIGMLRSMGIPLRSVTAIFSLNSMFIGLCSALIGGSAGIFFAARLESFIQLVEDFLNGSCSFFVGSCARIQLIPRDIYYFDHLPVSVNLGMIFAISMAAVVMSGLAGYLPARRAASMDPVRAIRSD